MPLKSKQRNPDAPFRRVVDFDTDERGIRLAVLSCGHKAPERLTDPKKLNSHMRCSKCKEEGVLQRLPGDSVNSSGSSRFCRRCGCRLRSSQTRAVCSPCAGG